MPRLIRIVLYLICCTSLLSSSAGSVFGYDLDQYLYPEDPARVSMDFKNANLNDVLKIFSQQAEMNFIASTEVANKMITLYMDNVAVDEALERILSANGLTYEIQEGSNIFIVKELSLPEKNLMTRVYVLKHATIPSSKINTTLTKDAENSDAEASISSGMVNALEAILTEDGSVVEDPRTNSLIVTDIPDQFHIIENTIARLDVRIPQILIETEMLDISKNSIEQLGAKWSGTFFEFVGGSKNTLFPFNTDNVFDDYLGGGEQKSWEDLGADNKSGYSAGQISFSGLSMALEFLRTQTDTKSLARPRILTLNNETAEISIKTNEAIAILTKTSSAEGLGEQTQEAERTETGVSLRVTPQANVSTREIVMAIEPTVTQARRSALTLNENPIKDPERRGTKSILRVKDGDTIVLGGLLRTEAENTRTKVPFMEKIPVIGAAFRHKDGIEIERELIIFITPHIITDTLAEHNTTEPFRYDDIKREQDIPNQRHGEIDRELSYYEQDNY